MYTFGSDQCVEATWSHCTGWDHRGKENSAPPDLGVGTSPLAGELSRILGCLMGIDQLLFSDYLENFFSLPDSIVLLTLVRSVSQHQELWRREMRNGSSLSVMVNFMYQLACVKRWPNSGQTLSLGVSIRVFLEDNSIWFSRLSKKRSFSPMWMGAIQSIEGKKVEEEWILFSLFELGCLFFSALERWNYWFLDLQTLVLIIMATPFSQVLRPLALNWDLYPLDPLVLRPWELD